VTSSFGHDAPSLCLCQQLRTALEHLLEQHVAVHHIVQADGSMPHTSAA